MSCVLKYLKIVGISTIKDTENTDKGKSGFTFIGKLRPEQEHHHQEKADPEWSSGCAAVHWTTNTDRAGGSIETSKWVLSNGAITRAVEVAS